MSATLLNCAPSPLNLPADAPVYVRRGRDAVLQSAELLAQLAEICGQPGAMSDLSYFLAKPGVLKRTPLLLLLGRGPRVAERALQAGDLVGALLVYEYRFSALKTGLYTSNDRSGRNTLVALPHLRSSVARFAACYLLEHGAQVMLLSFRDADASHSGFQLERVQDLPAAAKRSNWALRRREIPEFLPLAGTYDETLACIGQRTRSNLRYYRRRTERELGCTFHPEVELNGKELIVFNQACMYAVPDHVAIWRLSMMRSLKNPILMSLSDREGRLLSVLGGRRVGRSSEILWQMNREGLAHLSLSLVMRGYFLEHEIGQGAERFYIEGGTPHPIRESFTKATVTDLAVLRTSLTAALIRKLARHTVQEENDLATMLFDPELAWRPVHTPTRRWRRSVHAGQS